LTIENKSSGFRQGEILVLKENANTGGASTLNERDVKPTIGIITALPHEYAAVKVLLESQHPISVPGRGAGRQYLYGEVPALNGNSHPIVLALLPDTGNNQASARAALLLEHFPTINTIIMSGIAGGVPNPDKPSEHVRLGDIVVSNRDGVIQYDFGKEERKKRKVKISPRHPPRPPSASLIETAKLLQAGELESSRPWVRYINSGLKELSITRPSADTDVLASSTNAEVVVPHPADLRRVDAIPRVFLGPIASSNTLLKNPVRRDQLREYFGVKAVEMEGSGIADAAWLLEIPYLVIRGVCDYCDKNKGDDWQVYAAVVAAAYTRALLEATPAANSPEKPASQAQHSQREPRPLIPDVSAAIVQEEMRSGFADLKGELRTVLDKLSAENSQFDQVRQKLESRIADEYERRFKAAKSLFEQCLFEQAKASSEAILRDLEHDPDADDPALRARACTNIAVCAWHLHDIGEVIKWFEDAYKFTPEDPKCIANLATAQMFGGETRRALDTVERALEVNPDNADAIKTKANILLKEERYDDLSSFLEGKGQRDLRMFFSAVHLGAQQRHEEAAQVLRELLSSDPTNITYLERIAADILMSVRRQIEREHRLPWQITDGMRKAVEEAESHLTRELELLGSTEAKQKRVGAFINRSAARLMIGRSKEALEDCKEIVRLDPDNVSAYLNKSKAEMELEDYAAAAESLEKYAQLGGDISSQARDLLYAYYATGQSEKAKSFIKKEFDREWREEDLSVLSLAVLILDVSQDYESAAELVRRAQEAFPDHSATFTIRARYEQDIGGTNVEQLLRRALETASPSRKDVATLDLANYLYDLGRYEDAIPLLRQVISEEEFAPINYCYLVCLYNTGRFSEVVEFAAKMRGGEEIHQYISPIEALAYKRLEQLRSASEIFLRLYQRTPANTDYLVEYGICLFRLDEKEKAIRAFDQAKNRVTKTKDLVALARGYSIVGQSRTAIELGYRALEQDFGNEKIHRLYITLFLNMIYSPAVVEEKHAKAFEDARDNFNKRFPEAEGFKMVNIRENPTFFHDTLREREPSIAEVIEAYKQDQLPITSKAFLYGKDIFDSWSVLTSTKELGLKGSLAISEEQHKEMESAAQDGSIVVDLLALFTLGRLGKLDLLGKMFDRIYIHQAAFDELIESSNEESKHTGSGRKYFVLIDGRLNMREIPPEDIQRDAALLEEVRCFIKEKCEITGLLQELGDADQILIDSFGDASSYTALLAAQKGLRLLSDDGLLRMPLRNGHGVNGFSTQTLLRHAGERGILGKEDLFDSLLSLLSLHYRYIPVSDELLIYAFSKCGYSPCADFQLALEEIGRKEVTIESIAVAVGNFLKDLWLLSIPDVSKALALHSVLSVITTHHHRQKTALTLLRYLRPRMNLVLHLYADIQQQTKQWLAVAASD
jgi:nucleoside phosphorylase/tetratricopeptide (TPR) repeat protein